MKSLGFTRNGEEVYLPAGARDAGTEGEKNKEWRRKPVPRRRRRMGSVGSVGSVRCRFWGRGMTCWWSVGGGGGGGGGRGRAYDGFPASDPQWKHGGVRRRVDSSR